MKINKKEEIGHACALLSHDITSCKVWDECYELATSEREEGFVELCYAISELAIAYELEYQKRDEAGEENEWLEGIEVLVSLFVGHYRDQSSNADTVEECFKKLSEQDTKING